MQFTNKQGKQAHKLVCCIYMCITYVCLHGTSFKFYIHACVVYARSQKMIDEMKTSMHRKSNWTCAYHIKITPFHIMFISRGFLVFVNVQLLMVLRMVYIGNSNWYHASKVHSLDLSIIWQTLLPHNSNPCICASFQIQTLSTYIGEANTTNLG